MKKVLEGELTSLAHSILKSKADNVHELKEKAGLLFEKLCVLSFAEKHFSGKQPNIGKAAFKSAFEFDLTEVIITSETGVLKDNASIELENTVEKEVVSTEKTEYIKDIQKEEQAVQGEFSSESEKTSVENEPISTEKTEDIKDIKLEGQTGQGEFSVESEETPVESEAISTEKTEDIQHEEQTGQGEFLVESEETPVENEPISTEKTEDIQKEEQTGQVKTSIDSENTSTGNEEVIPQKEKAIAEEDFGVHYDDLPDFEPVVRPNNPTQTNTDNPAKNNLEKASTEKENSSTEREKKLPPVQEKPKPQRTMDLFSQHKKSLNDQLKTELKIGLNDRLAFTKKLFNGNVDAYNLAIAKMKDFSSFQEAKAYLMSEVKPNYAWNEHETVEQRFLEILEAKIG